MNVLQVCILVNLATNEQLLLEREQCLAESLNLFELMPDLLVLHVV